ncbi:uncharacterized protein LOC110456143 [Mizuhopecten yessoensis]|uniref:uncharacterized protein LOC110456143 n=1 Tax=Mizuhopecten yessoensis TaxID=6573 RepID=UPI000B457EFC|nr:uncharacterized protein LOC110456143 [Mizuhopecten yessoensis]
MLKVPPVIVVPWKILGISHSLDFNLRTRSGSHKDMLLCAVVTCVIFVDCSFDIGRCEMKAVLISIAVVACCMIAVRGEAYGNYGNGQYVQKGHTNQYSKGGYAKGYSTYPTYSGYYSGYSGYGQNPVAKKEIIFGAPLFAPPPAAPLPADSGSLFGGDGTIFLFLLFLLPILLNDNLSG